MHASLVFFPTSVPLSSVTPPLPSLQIPAATRSWPYSASTVTLQVQEIACHWSISTSSLSGLILQSFAKVAVKRWKQNLSFQSAQAESSLFGPCSPLLNLTQLLCGPLFPLPAGEVLAALELNPLLPSPSGLLPSSKEM